MQSIVVVDDESDILDIQREALQDLEILVNTFSDPNDAWTFIQRESTTLVVTDWNMPGMTGMDLLFKIRGLSRPPYVIVLTAHGTIERAVKALNQGAFDFLEKPFNIERYTVAVKRALQSFRSASQPVGIRKSTGRTPSPFANPIKTSSLMKDVYERAKTAAETDTSILLLGESGTGKEVLADFIHGNSPRAAGPIIKVNCAALPEHLMESELFGHEKGAFTGAERRNIGRFEQANGGTLFLDEIGDLPLTLQVKLLRALQERTIERIGSGTPLRVDFRLVCATHRNLKGAVADGKFREDLYYRINVLPIRMPALRERLEEVPPLAEHFLNALSATMNSPPKKLSEEALACLSAYNWPGNVRQLRNAVEYAVVLSKGQLIGADGLPEEVRNSSRSTEVTSSTHVIPPTSPVAIIEPAHFATPLPATQMPNGLRDSVREAEIQLIRTTLEKNRWQISKVAKELKISRSTLYQRMKEYGVTR